MLYTFLFFVRYWPFWAIPVSLVFFEIGTYYYNRRDRIPFMSAYSLTAFLVITSILWIGFEGYWRAGPFVKKVHDAFTKPPQQ